MKLHKYIESGDDSILLYADVDTPENTPVLKAMVQVDSENSVDIGIHILDVDFESAAMAVCRETGQDLYRLMANKRFYFQVIEQLIESFDHNDARALIAKSKHLSAMA